jgi:hypothetical protein
VWRPARVKDDQHVMYPANRPQLRPVCVGPSLLDYLNPLSGTDMGYYWIRADALVA